MEPGADQPTQGLADRDAIARHDVMLLDDCLAMTQTQRLRAVSRAWVLYKAGQARLRDLERGEQER